jgi:ADP-heptose:LPS heptosyltransferase
LSYLLSAREKRVLRSRPDGRHQVERLAEVLGLDPPPAPRLWIGGGHRAEACARLGEGGPLLALGPAANWRGKEWPRERFVELARRLTGAGGLLGGARVVLLGAAAEREAGRPLVERLGAGQVIDLIGEVGLLTAAAVIERCNLYVGNDSGLMHIAAATGVPTLGLFGPSRDEHYAPWGEATAVVRTPESCDELIERPGYDHRTTGSLMGSLAVDAVEAAAVALVRRCRVEAS